MLNVNDMNVFAFHDYSRRLAWSEENQLGMLNFDVFAIIQPEQECLERLAVKSVLDVDCFHRRTIQPCNIHASIANLSDNKKAARWAA